MRISKKIHEEGTKAILITFAIVAAIVILVNWLWPSQTVWHYILYAFVLLVLIMTVRFFRVPIWRKTTIVEDAVLARLKEETEKPYNDKRQSNLQKLQNARTRKKNLILAALEHMEKLVG